MQEKRLRAATRQALITGRTRLVRGARWPGRDPQPPLCDQDHTN
jgi:hypothetical protein